MDSMRTILQKEMLDYAGEGLNAYAYLTISADRQVYAVIDVTPKPDGRLVDVSLLVRLRGNCIIIEHDINSDPLVDALLQAGIPRNQIVLAYAGEAAEEAA